MAFDVLPQVRAALSPRAKEHAGTSREADVACGAVWACRLQMNEGRGGRGRITRRAQAGATRSRRAAVVVRELGREPCRARSAAYRAGGRAGRRGVSGRGLGRARPRARRRTSQGRAPVPRRSVAWSAEARVRDRTGCSFGVARERVSERLHWPRSFLPLDSAGVSGMIGAPWTSCGPSSR